MMLLINASYITLNLFEFYSNYLNEYIIMVKTKKSANKSESEIESTDTIESKTKTLVFDEFLSPLLCRKLNFTSKKSGNFKDNIPKQIIAHTKTKNSILFTVEWENTQREIPLPTKANLKSVREHCPDLLIDYLITKL